MWYFADKLGDVSLLHYELRMLDIQPHRSSCAEKRLLPMVMPFVSRLNPGTVPPPSDKVWAGNGKTPVVLVRTGWAWDETDRFLGLKGGKASTSHGHMDAGSSSTTLKTCAGPRISAAKTTRPSKSTSATARHGT